MGAMLALVAFVVVKSVQAPPRRPPPPPHDYADIARRLVAGKGSTYVDEILRQRNGNVARWVDRRSDPIRVWIQPTSRLQWFFPDFASRAADGFRTWNSAGIPLRFTFISDSANAEVRLHWVDRFGDAAVGKTYWARDQHWWIVGAEVEIALRAQSGRTLDAVDLRTVALVYQLPPGSAVRRAP